MAAGELGVEQLEGAGAGERGAVADGVVGGAARLGGGRAETASRKRSSRFCGVVTSPASPTGATPATREEGDPANGGARGRPDAPLTS